MRFLFFKLLIIFIKYFIYLIMQNHLIIYQIKLNKLYTENNLIISKHKQYKLINWLHFLNIHRNYYCILYIQTEILYDMILEIPAKILECIVTSLFLHICLNERISINSLILCFILNKRCLEMNILPPQYYFICLKYFILIK